MPTSESSWPDEGAVYRYLIGGTTNDEGLEPEPGNGPRYFDGSVEELRDLLRGRQEPLSGGVISVAVPAAAKGRGRTTVPPFDPLTLLDSDFAARFSSEVPAPQAQPAHTDVASAAWFGEHGDTIWAIFMSGSFGSRVAVSQVAVLRAFYAYRHGRGGADRAFFWRLLNLELWLREHVDTDPHDSARPPVPLVEVLGPEYETAVDGQHQQAPPKSDYQPNLHKRLLIANGRWARFPLRVDLVAEGDDVPALVAKRAAEFFAGLDGAGAEVATLTDGQPWYVFIGEKMVAVAQGRFVLIDSVRPGRAARLLVRTVKSSPFESNISQPETMQVAIDEAGLPRMLLAAGAAAVGKVLRRPGWFYLVVGSTVASIDSPNATSAYPANVAAKLAPTDPSGVARAVSAAIRAQLPAEAVVGFGGTVIIDSNDLGRDILGHDTGAAPATLAGAYSDNPTGQGREQTPISIVFAQPDPARLPS